MKTDERLSERITLLERDIKVLKSEVQAVLVDLREKFMESDNPFNAPSAQTPSQQLFVLQTPAAPEARPDKESHDSPAEKEALDSVEEPETTSEAKGDKTEAGREKHAETAREEVIHARAPQVPVEAPFNNTRAGREDIPDRDINLIRIGGLVTWVEQSVKKLGHQKTEAILDVAEMMGLISPQLKQIMTKLANIDSDGNLQSVSARVFLESLVKVTTLLGKDNQTEAALLSILSEEEDDHG